MGTLSCGLAIVGLILLVADIALEGSKAQQQGRGVVMMVVGSAFVAICTAGIFTGLIGTSPRRLGRLKALGGLVANVVIMSVFGTFVWWPTPGTLLQAAATGDIDNLKRSIDMGVDINSRAELYDPSRAVTPLIAAIEHGQTKAVELLLNQGSDVTVPDSLGQTPLYQATLRGQLESVSLLLGRGADPNVAVGDETCLYHAAGSGDVEIVRHLLEHGAHPNHPRRPPLLAAAKAGQTRVVQMLLKGDADVNAQDPQGNTALHLAASNGHLFTVQILLTNKADANITNRAGETALDRAIQSSHPNVTSALLKAGGELDLFMAIGLGDVERARSIVETSPELVHATKRGRTSLHEAARWGLTDIAAILLEHGAVPDALSEENKRTPLHWAVLENHPGVVQMLLEHKADPNLPLRYQGSTAPPLYFAVTKGNVAVTELLLKHGAEVNAQCESGNMSGTLLFFAVVHGRIATAEILLNHKADVDGRLNDRSPTPLYEAIRQGDYEMVDLLVHFGAKVNQNVMGQSLLHFANSRHHHSPWKYDQIIKVLRESGAKD